MVETRKNVALPPGRAAKKAKPKVPKAVRVAAQAYKDAYKAVYGIRPSLRWDGQWIRISGQSQGVKLSRLKALTTQLRLRAD